MPLEIKWFERCFIYWMSLGVISRIMARDWTISMGADPTTSLISIIFWTSLPAWLGWLVSRRHKRWPVWVLVVFVASSYAMIMYALWVNPEISFLNGVWWLDAMTLSMLVAQVVGFYMVLFTRAGREWTSKQARIQPVASTARLGL